MLAMSTFVSPQIFLVSLLAGWLNQEQQKLLEYLRACWSKTIRTARSFTSGEYLLRLVMTPSSQELESPGNPGRFTRPGPPFPEAGPPHNQLMEVSECGSMYLSLFFSRSVAERNPQLVHLCQLDQLLSL